MRGRILFGLSLVSIAAVVCIGVVGLARFLRPVPTPQVRLMVPPRLIVDAAAPVPLALPAAGSLELTSSVDGHLADIAADQVRPIGSVAKTMTALVTLEARPLGAGEEGPAYVITANDVTLYRQALDQNGSTVEVREGERFSERQLLLALMLPSANNLAETLALWVGGSRPGFIARLNARAVQLGMTGTHFDDPSGYSDATVSTAADLVRLGGAAIANPALAAVVATKAATLPDGSTVENLDSNLGSQPGWLGIKTGSTNLAGGCLLFAAERTPAGAPSPVRVVGAILGQPTLEAALAGAGQAAVSALTSYDSVDLGASTPQVDASVTSEWGAGSPLAVVSLPGTRVTLRRGASLDLSTSLEDLTAPLAAGSVAATVTGRLAGRIVAAWRLQTTRMVAGPSVLWRVTHG